MQIHVFRGPGRVFACTTESTGANLPAEFAPWSPFKTIDLVRGVPTPGLRTDECLDDIEKYGIHVTDAHVRITDKFVS